jgi:hypothetical protein
MTTQTPSAAQRTVELPIDALSRLYLAVVATSKIPEQQWHELFNGRVAAECVQCGIKVTGEELRQLSVLDPEHPVDDPKLDRLRLKYCARNTCQSRFYRVKIEPDSDLHWTAIKEQLQLATPEVRETKERKAIKLPALGLPRTSGLTISVALLCLVVLFFMLRYWVFGHRIPVVHKKHEYRVIEQPQPR